MREIEFRIRYRDKSWFYGVPITKIKNDTVGFQSLDNSYYDLFADATTLCQYTGIKDKNGTKIFEGDIVKGYWNTIFQVYFDEDYLQFRAKLLNGSHREIDYYGDKSKIEIIGNIYDNPELMGNNK